jgi:sulfur carrier protein ThiS
MEMHLGGHLSWYVPERKSWIEIRLSEPTSLADILKILGIPVDEVAVGALNGEPIAQILESRITDVDRVELYPPVGGG